MIPDTRHFGFTWELYFTPGYEGEVEWRTTSDDGEFIVHNALVQNPGWTSAKRFLSEVFEPSTVHGYYIPLAMISLMLDNAAGGRSDDLRQFHRTNLALHVMSTAGLVLLLYLLFKQPLCLFID